MKLGQWLGLLAFAVSLYIIWQIRQLLLLLFTAVVLAVAINQLVRQLEKIQIKRIWAVWLSLAIFVTLLAGFFLLIVPPFIEQFQQLLALLPTGIERIQQGINWLEDRIQNSVIPEIPDVNGFVQQLQPLSTNLLGRAIAFFSSSLNMVLELFIPLLQKITIDLGYQPDEEL